MDDTLVTVYRAMVLHSGCSAEDILEDPELRSTFLAEVRALTAAETPERQILHRLSYLRKQGRLPRLRDMVIAAD